MLEQLELATQRWGGKLPLVDNWLSERRELLVHYCHLAGADSQPDGRLTLPPLKEVSQFCQLLVDYISSGRFEIYDKLLNLCENSSDDLAGEAHKLIPGLSAGSDHALRFNDSYGELTSESQLLALDDDLSQLGEWLEQHLRLEDRLLQAAFQAQQATGNQRPAETG